jgi:hypothetical protein
VEIEGFPDTLKSIRPYAIRIGIRKLGFYRNHATNNPNLLETSVPIDLGF